MKIAVALSAAIAACVIVPDTSRAEETGIFPSSYTQQVCKRLERGARTGRKHRAFAINESGDHCGSAYGYLYKKEAEHRALNTCRKNTKEKCRLVFSE